MLGLKQKLVARKERKYWNLLQEVTTLRETVCSKRESERETDRDLLKGMLEKRQACDIGPAVSERKGGTCCH